MAMTRFAFVLSGLVVLFGAGGCGKDNPCARFGGPKPPEGDWSAVTKLLPPGGSVCMSKKGNYDELYIDYTTGAQEVFVAFAKSFEGAGYARVDQDVSEDVKAVSFEHDGLPGYRLGVYDDKTGPGMRGLTSVKILRLDH
jgi:hypothetical protein